MFGFIQIFPFLLLSFIGCDTGSILDRSANDGVEEAIDTAPVSRALADELTDRVNEARRQARRCGSSSFPAAPPLKWNNALAEAALQHARDMAANDHFSHTGAGGSDPADRIAAAGYQALTWGENIAAGQRSAEQVLATWLESPGHCANLMNGRFTELGAAFAESDASTYGIFWTMVLAAPR